MTAKLRILTVSALLALPLVSTALQRAELLPPNAQTYVRVSDTTSFWSQLKHSSLGKLWVDPQFQDFLGNPDAETLQEALFEGEPDAEDKIMLEQLKMLKGEIVVGIDLDTEQPYIIAAMSKDDFERSLVLDAELKETQEEPFETIRSTFQDVEIIQYIDDAGTPDEESSWQAHVDGTFFMGYTREWVEKCIVQLKSDKPTEPEGHPAFNLNIPISHLIRQIIEEEDQSAGTTADPFTTEQLFDTMGLMGVEHFTLNLELKETEMVADGHLKVSDLTKGFFTLLDVQPAKLPSVNFIPESLSSIEVGRFNLLRFWQEIPIAITSLAPESKMQYDMMLGMIQAQAGINFEQDLLTHLDTHYVSFSVEEGEIPVAVVALALKDAAAFRTGLETALSAPALQPQVAAGLETEKFLDHTLYTVISEDPDTVAFGVAAGHLLYGQPDALRQVIRRASSETAPTGSYEQTELIKGLRNEAPDSAFQFGAIDWKKYMDALVHGLNTPEIAMAFAEGWASSGSALPPPDLSKLPPADHIASFFNVSYHYAEATADGIHQRIILKY